MSRLNQLVDAFFDSKCKYLRSGGINRRMSPVFNQSRRELRYVIGRTVGFESASPKGFGQQGHMISCVFSNIVNIQQGSHYLHLCVLSFIHLRVHQYPIS